MDTKTATNEHKMVFIETKAYQTKLNYNRKNDGAMQVSMSTCLRCKWMDDILLRLSVEFYQHFLPIMYWLLLLLLYLWHAEFTVASVFIWNSAEVDTESSRMVENICWHTFFHELKETSAH